jgi:hypothetical protein
MFLRTSSTILWSTITELVMQFWTVSNFYARLHKSIVGTCQLMLRTNHTLFLWKYKCTSTDGYMSYPRRFILLWDLSESQNKVNGEDNSCTRLCMYKIRSLILAHAPSDHKWVPDLLETCWMWYMRQRYYIYYYVFHWLSIRHYCLWPTILLQIN